MPNRTLTGLMTAVILTFIATECIAQSEEKDHFDSAINEMVAAETLSNAQRIKVAQAISGVCNEIDRKIPSLSPREEDWLNKEEEEGRDILYTVEFARQISKIHLGQCKKSADQIIHYTPLSSYSKSQPLMWVVLIQSISNPHLEHKVAILHRSDAIVTEEDWIYVRYRFPLASHYIRHTIVLPDLFELSDQFIRTE